MEHSTLGNTLTLAGALDVRCTADLRVALYSVLGRTSDEVIVDIEAVESIDMTTLKLIAVANRFAERQGRRIVLRGASPGVRRLLHLSHLRPMIPVAPYSHPTQPHSAT